MTEEGINMRNIMLKLSGLTTLFRNNTGTAWQGTNVKLKGVPYTYQVLKDARPVQFGLFKGSSDLIGITPIVITQDMVGKRVGVFTAIEVKANQKKTASPEQIIFINRINELGGIALICSSPDDAEQKIKNFLFRVA